jgi:hypothetical protein
MRRTYSNEAVKQMVQFIGIKKWCW